VCQQVLLLEARNPLWCRRATSLWERGATLARFVARGLDASSQRVVPVMRFTCNIRVKQLFKLIKGQGFQVGQPGQAHGCTICTPQHSAGHNRREFSELSELPAAVSVQCASRLPCQGSTQPYPTQGIMPISYKLDSFSSLSG
jgi:hypothetical protein